MNTKEFIKLVRDMRNFQRKHFRNRNDRKSLKAARLLEVEVDKYLRKIKDYNYETNSTRHRNTNSKR